jgi:hypothetical protein
MARGHPDYNIPLTNIGSVSFDIAELAARLGSLSRIDRLGSVIYQDDFDNGLSRWTLVNGLDAYTHVITSPVFDGDASIKLGVNQPTSLGDAIYKVIPLHDANRMGFEFTYALAPIGEVNVIPEFRAYIYTMTSLYRCYLKIHPLNHIIYLYTQPEGQPAGYYVALDDMLYLAPVSNYVTWHHCKIVIDIDKGKYQRLYHDQFTADLTSYPLISGANPGYSGMTLAFFTNLGSAPGYWILDNLIVTINEP